MTTTSYMNRIIARFERKTAKPYTPRFRVERELMGWRLFDGAREIGFVLNRGWHAFDLWSFSPFAPPIEPYVRSDSRVMDLHTMRNTALNLPFDRAGELIEGVTDPFGRLRENWVSGKGAALDLEIAGTFDRGQRAVCHFRVVYDPRWARYRFFLDVDVWKLTYEGFEPINMMMAGALVSRPERVRWTHSLWEDPDGRLKRLVHSNALFSATDYASHGNGEWRSKNAPVHGAWIAYAANLAFNPALLIHASSAPVFFATCSQLFDEHVIWQKAGLDQLDEGFFRFSIRTELVNLDAGLAASWLEQAGDPPHPKAWREPMLALPCHMSRTNGFGKPLDPWQPETCPIFVVPPAASGAPACWDNAVGHGDKRSLRLEGRVWHRWTRLSPGGAVCDVEPHARYRLSAWVKTRGVERFARLDLFSYEYAYDNVIETAHSAHVDGSRDWSLLQVELDTGEEAYVMPQLSLYGVGTAWFDDLTLERVL